MASSQVQSIVTSMMVPLRVRSGPVDPPMIKDTITVTKKVQVTLPTPAEGTAILTPSVLMAGVPGGLTYWRDVRIERVDVWSNSSSSGTDTLTVTVAGESDWNQTVEQYIDTGVYGSRRARVSFKLGLLARSRFWNTADNTPICAVSVDGGASNVIIQATVQLNSNFLT